MKNESIVFYLLMFLVAVTFSVIGWLYQSSVSSTFIFYSALVICVGLLRLLFYLQHKHFKKVITKISGTIDRDWLQGLFSNFPMSMLVVNSEAEILYANHQSCEIFSLDNELIINL